MSGRSTGAGPLMFPRLFLGGLMRIKIVRKHGEEGKVGWILLWLLGVPVPILLILFVLRGCT